MNRFKGRYIKITEGDNAGAVVYIVDYLKRDRYGHHIIGIMKRKSYKKEGKFYIPYDAEDKYIYITKERWLAELI